MPTPRQGEGHDPFIKRCIPVVIRDGTAKDGAQAKAICESMWSDSRQTKARAQAMGLLIALAAHRALSPLTPTQTPARLDERPPPPSLFVRLWRMLLNAGKDGADAASATDPGMATITTRFDIRNPRAIAKAQVSAGNLIVEISSSSRKEISSMVVQALRTGMSPRVVARHLRQMVTLNTVQQQYVLDLVTELRTAEAGQLITRFPPRPGVRTIHGFRARVPSGGPTQAWVNRNTIRYERMQLALRTRTIARSSAHRSVNGGQRELWLQAQDSGQLRRDAERVWLTAGDNRVRAAHEAIDGETTGIEEDFSIGVDPGEEPNCRCGQAISPREGVGAPRPLPLQTNPVLNPI